MGRTKLLIGFILLSTPFAVCSQVLEGRITHDLEGEAGVHIINRSSKRATITNEQGRFRIPVQVGDTLFISSLNLEQKTLKVDSVLYQKGWLLLDLEEQVVALDEVVVRPFNLSGDLQTDMEDYFKGEVATAASLGLPNAYARPYSQSERLLHEATSGGGIPLNPILNGISGRTRMLKSRVKRDRTYLKTQEVRKRIGDTLIAKDLKIPLSRIADFMYYCEVDEKFQQHVARGDLIKLLDVMKEKSETYRALNEL